MFTSEEFWPHAAAPPLTREAVFLSFICASLTGALRVLLFICNRMLQFPEPIIRPAVLELLLRYLFTFL